jgi:hypothetical protein
MATTTVEPRVWIGCLACYNAGRLMGAWVDAIDAGDFDRDRVHGSGATRALVEVQDGGSPHEELWCFDLEGLGGFVDGECSPAEAQRVAELLEAIEADGVEVEAVRAWIGWVGWSGRTPMQWDEIREGFEDAYAGHADSGSDYAEELADELGAFMVGGDGYGRAPVDVSGQWPMTCIDWDRAWRELELGDGMAAIDDPAGGVFVFRST